MSFSRRYFISSLGILGVTYFGASCGKKPTAMAASSLFGSDNPEDFEPASSIHSLGDYFVWVGSLKVGASLKFVLISKRGLDVAEVIGLLSGPTLVRNDSDRCLYARALGGHSLQVSLGSPLQLVLLQDGGSALSECQFSRARVRDRFIQAGVEGLTSGSIGLCVPPNAAPVLAVRPIGESDSELLLFVGNADPLRARVSWPIARDNPVLMSNPHGLDWIVYPSLTFKRRQDFKPSLNGIPVCRVDRQLSLNMTWVPWADWNQSGPYRFYAIGYGLVAITLSGIYLQGDKGWAGWFHGDFDPASLSVSADQTHLAWIERVKLTSPSPIYGQYRKIVRIETI